MITIKGFVKFYVMGLKIDMKSIKCGIQTLHTYRLANPSIDRLIKKLYIKYCMHFFNHPK